MTAVLAYFIFIGTVGLHFLKVLDDTSATYLISTAVFLLVSAQYNS